MLQQAPRSWGGALPRQKFVPLYLHRSRCFNPESRPPFPTHDVWLSVRGSVDTAGLRSVIMTSLLLHSPLHILCSLKIPQNLLLSLWPFFLCFRAEFSQPLSVNPVTSHIAGNSSKFLICWCCHFLFSWIVMGLVFSEYVFLYLQRI